MATSVMQVARTREGRTVMVGRISGLPPVKDWTFGATSRFGSSHWGVVQARTDREARSLAAAELGRRRATWVELRVGQVA